MVLELTSVSVAFPPRPPYARAASAAVSLPLRKLSALSKAFRNRADSALPNNSCAFFTWTAGSGGGSGEVTGLFFGPLLFNYACINTIHHTPYTLPFLLILHVNVLLILSPSCFYSTTRTRLGHYIVTVSQGRAVIPLWSSSSSSRKNSVIGAAAA